MFSSLLRATLFFQLSHIAASVVWNAAGVYLVSRGEQALGPTASLTTVFILLVLAGLLLFSASRLKWVYLGVSGFLFFGALLAIYGGFTKPPLLWPSDTWRVTGITINLLGVAGFALACVLVSQNSKPDG